jgi:hypothetical protein
VTSASGFPSDLRRLLATALWCGGWLGSLARPITAQPSVAHVVAHDRALCTSCRVELRRVASISDSTISISGIGAFLMRERNGTYILGSRSGEVVRVSGDGRILPRVGRRGAGPREFIGPFHADVGKADTVFVADKSTRRISLVDLDGGIGKRSVTVGNLASFLVQADNSFVLSGSGMDRASIGHVLHLHASDGRYVRSASASRSTTARVTPVTFFRSLAPATNARFVAAPLRRYELEIWSSQLQLREVIKREAPWFPSLPDDAGFDLPSRKPMPSTILGLLGSDRSDTLLVIIRTGARGFVPSPAIAAGEEGIDAYPGGAGINRYVDTVFELVDLARRSVTVSHRVRGGYFPVLNSMRANATPQVWKFGEATDGSLQIEVFDFRVLAK